MTTIVVKVSGSLLKTDAQIEQLWASVAALRMSAQVLVVHGGGAQATALARRLGHEPTFVQGRRVTTDVDLDVAQWALRGKVNTDLVAGARRQRVSAVGVSGVDGNLIQVTKRPTWTVSGREVDFGWVGDVEGVDASVLTALLDAEMVPVVAPLAAGADGQVYNVNADTVARAVAEALGASELLLVTNTGGVRREAGDPATHLSHCDAETYQTGVDEGWIEGGMRVKLHTALEAVQHGVGAAFVCALDDLCERTRATKVFA